MEIIYQNTWGKCMNISLDCIFALLPFKCSNDFKKGNSDKPNIFQFFKINLH